MNSGHSLGTVALCEGGSKVLADPEGHLLSLSPIHRGRSASARCASGHRVHTRKRARGVHLHYGTLIGQRSTGGWLLSCPGFV
jgi:hypothetical protein